jgi:hypothetical protein
MTWAPLPTVTVDGVDFTGDTVGDLTIVRGRDTVYADPATSYARIQLVDLTGFGFDLDITRNVTVKVKDSASADLTVFQGQIVEISADLYDAGLGSNRPAALYNVFAVGPLARLARRNVLAGGRPAETEGERIAAAIEDGLSTTWEETAGAWEDVDPTTTWATFDADFDPALIDAGVFDITALPAEPGGYSALEVITIASNSGDGLLYETLDGKVGWANADARGLASSPTAVPADAIIALGTRSSSSAGDLANRVTVQYDGGAETAQEDVSLTTYGLYERIITTILTDATNAGDRAEAYVERHAYPAVNLGRITMRLDAITDDTLRDDLLEVYSGSPIYLEDLPPTLGIRFLDGFVEGTQLGLSRFRAELRLNVSDGALSRFAVRWSGVEPTLAWEDVSATLTFADARTVTA